MDNQIRKQLEAYIDAHTGEMLEDIMRLCRIDSVRDTAAEGKPYGAGPYAALAEAGAICSSYGFRTAYYDNRVMTADLEGSAPCLDILAHMDVVAAGEGWTKTAPFEPKLIGDVLYGRGSSDDKGPAMAALYAMRAVKELGIPLKGRCRLILGSDEENGSSDLPYYYAKEKEAPMSFSPDAEFPVINIEKGQFRGTVRLDYAEDGKSDESGKVRLILAESGDTINIVPQKALAVLAGISEEAVLSAADEVRRETGAEFTAEAKMTVSEESGEKVCSLLIGGKPAHASKPQEGVNAAVLLLLILAKVRADGAGWQEAVRKLSALFPYGDHEGHGLGIAASDPASGSTSISMDILKIRDGRMEAFFDARTCIAANEANTVYPLRERLEKDGMTFTYTFNPPHAVDGDSHFVQTLISCYEEVTGKKGECLAIGGGTYVHELQNGVAFGAVGAETDAHMHGVDEFMPVRELRDAALIYALAIVQLCS